MIVMSFDGNLGDMVLNFPEEVIKNLTLNEMKRTLKSMVEKLIDFQKKYDIREIRLRHEPIFCVIFV